MNKRAIIIQARNGSTRFPKKMMENIDGKDTSVFAFLLKRLQKVFDNEHIFLATTTLAQDTPLCDIANKHGIRVYRGDEHNVLSRFIECATQYHVQEIIRVCADNPFLSLEDLEKIKKVDLADKDYISFDIKGQPSITTHYGFWTELVSLQALQKVAQHTNEALYLEHVTNFIYNNPQLFKVQFIDTDIPSAFLNQDIRLTLDTVEDMQSIKYIIQAIDKDMYQITLADVWKVIQQRPQLLQNMLTQIQANTK